MWVIAATLLMDDGYDEDGDDDDADAYDGNDGSISIYGVFIFG